MATDTTNTTTSLPSGSTNTQGLAGWAAPYITNYLGQAQALGNTPYQTYQGPLTAGQSGLQTQAFSGIGGLTVPNQGQYTPVGGSFTDQGVAQQYMNPYLDMALQPQLQELQRQSMINLQPQMAKLTQAGGYGGSREAILRGEGQRNLLDQTAQTTGQAYNTAYQQAMNQFNAEQQRKVQEAQFGSEFGLKGLAAQQGVYDQMLKAGDVERGITSEGIKADLDEFNRQREFPYKQIQFQRDMISGLPVGSVTNTPAGLSGIAQLLTALGGADKVMKDTGTGSLSSLLGNLFGLNLGEAV